MQVATRPQGPAPEVLPPNDRRRLLPLLSLIGVLLLAACLQLYDLGGKSLWLDEAGAVRLAQRPSVAAVLEVFATEERQPPAHFLLLHGWLQVAGSSEVAARLPSALLTIATTGLVAWIGHRLGGLPLALLAGVLVAISPFMVLYGRMARYYALGTFLLTLSTALLVELLMGRPARRAWPLWAGYAVSASLAVLTSYLSLGVLLAHGAALLIVTLRQWRQPIGGACPAPSVWQALARSPLAGWVLAQGCVAAALGAWIWLLSARFQVLLASPDPTNRQGLKALPLDLFSPIAAYGVGETLFPWDPLAVFGLSLVLGLVAVGLLQARRRTVWWWLPALGFALPVLLTTLVLQVAARDQPFSVVASKTVGAAPMLLLLVAFGLASLPVRRRVLGLAGLAVVAVAANVNYFAGQQFLNPSYAVPAREMVALTLAGAGPADLVLADDALIVPYYVDRAGAPIEPIPVWDEVRVAAALRDPANRRAWLITLGGYGSTLTPPDLRTRLLAGFRPVQAWEFAPQDPLYRELKARWQGTHEGPYRGRVELFER